MKVTIVGPNLPRQAKATQHVHRAGCSDLKRGWIKNYVGSYSWTIDVEDRLDVEQACYDFAPAESEGYVLGNYQSEFYFAPCLDDLELRVRDRDPAEESAQGFLESLDAVEEATGQAVK